MVLPRFVYVTLFLALTSLTLPCAAETVLLDFSSPDCRPCQQMRPIVNRLAAEGYRVQEINIQSEPQIAARFGVTKFPTFIVLVDGRETNRLVGLTSYQQLQQMLSQQQSQPTARGQSPDTFAGPGVSNIPSTFAPDDPAVAQPGRMVDVRQPPAMEAPQQAVENPFSAPPPRQPFQPAGSPAGNSRLIEATVKVSVQDPDGKSAGTGTIVDARGGEALVLTCGHLFRESEGKGPIVVTLFQAGPAGAEIRTTAPGRLIDFDLERDLALVSMKTDVQIQPVAIAPVGTPLIPNSAVTTVGCNHGENATAIASHITAIDRYQGYPNVEVAGAPVEGRSGGGLFNAQGQLIGVCFAADPEANEGLYASLPSIVAKLDSLGLAMVYQGSGQATPQAPPAQQIAAAPEPNFAVRGQEPVMVAPNIQPPTTSVASAPPATPLSPSEQATLEELQRRSQNSEVICIVRPKTADGKSEVISLSNASSEFVRSLTELAAARDRSRR